jgi:hypothetical protein
MTANLYTIRDQFLNNTVLYSALSVQLIMSVGKFVCAINEL